MEDECSEIVIQLWNQNLPRVCLEQKLRRCGDNLTKWSLRKYKRSSVEIQGLIEKLKNMKDDENQENIGDIRRLWKKLNLLLDQENLRWKQ